MGNISPLMTDWLLIFSHHLGSYHVSDPILGTEDTRTKGKRTGLPPQGTQSLRRKTPESNVTCTIIRATG